MCAKFFVPLQAKLANNKMGYSQMFNFTPPHTAKMSYIISSAVYMHASEFVHVMF